MQVGMRIEQVSLITGYGEGFEVLPDPGDYPRLKRVRGEGQQLWCVDRQALAQSSEERLTLATQAVLSRFDRRGPTLVFSDPRFDLNTSFLHQHCPGLLPIVFANPGQLLATLERQQHSLVIGAMDSTINPIQPGDGVYGEASVFFRLTPMPPHHATLTWSRVAPTQLPYSLSRIIFPQTSYTPIAAQIATRLCSGGRPWPRLVNLESWVGQLGAAAPAFSLAFGFHQLPEHSLVILPQDDAIYFLTIEAQAHDSITTH